MRKLAVQALRVLAEKRPLAEINYGDIATEAGLPWQTIKRVLGPREQLNIWLDDNTPEPLDTRDRIIESAARVFARKGYLSATLDEVAADAGMTKGAVYWHFDSKNELFFALLDSRFKTQFEELLPTELEAHDANADAKAALLDLLSGVVDRLEHDPDWPRLLLEFMGQARENEVRRRLGDAYLASYKMSAQLIDHMYRVRGDEPPADTELMAIFWSALMDGLIMAWIVNPLHVRMAEIMPRIVDLLWMGIAPRKQ
ncbi:TetR/AcrR family transcriptional regulator [Burkholderiaceae bacterium DAT-1]|nr:TetR/AcrR family transcriptional regulator [Burkholderiaceae bacterium DAT-1]